ncbi:hypothetical protein HPB47_015484, partial [Ixodes persulcatus]
PVHVTCTGVSAPIRRIRLDCIVFGSCGPSRLCLAMHSYTVQKKIKVVEWHRRNGRNRPLNRSAIKLDRKRIRETSASRSSGKRASVFSKEVDDALFKLLERERSAGHAATNDNQKVPEECADAAKAFRSALGCLRSCHEYTLHNMANMNQTMVRMDTAANRTNKLAGASTVRIANTG